MSYTVKGNSIGGKKVDLTYGAVHLPVSDSGGRMKRSRVIRDHLSSHRSRYCLVVRGGGLDYWWAAEAAGVCFAAGIEAWIMAEAEAAAVEENRDASDPEEEITFTTRPHIPDEFMVVVPLDSRVYLSQVVSGVVRDERIVPPAVAEKQVGLAAEDGTVVYAFSSGSDGGEAAERIQAHVELEEPPFDLLGHRFQPAWKVLARHGLLHPVHLMGVAGMALFLGLATVSGPAAKQVLAELSRLTGGLLGDLFYTEPVQDVVDAVVPVPILAVEPTVEIVPKVAHTAGTDLENLARYLVLAESLYGDGVRTLKWTGHSVELGGRAGADRQVWSTRARTLSRSLSGSSFGIGRDGWSVRLTVPGTSPADSREPLLNAHEVMEYLMAPHPVGFRLDAGPEPVEGREDRRANTQEITLRRTVWTAIVDGGVVGTLVSQANEWMRHENLPGSLQQAECLFEEWRLRSCTVTLEVMSL